MTLKNKQSSSKQKKTVDLIEFVSFAVDASKAGEGQLEISINKGEVANKVDV